MKQINLIPLILVVYLAKSFLIPTTQFDYGVLGFMSLLWGFKFYLEKSERDDKSEILSKIEELTQELNKIDRKHEVAHQNIEGKMAAVNLGLGNKTFNVRK